MYNYWSKLIELKEAKGALGQTTDKLICIARFAPTNLHSITRTGTMWTVFTILSSHCQPLVLETLSQVDLVRSNSLLQQNSFLHGSVNTSFFFCHKILNTGYSEKEIARFPLHMFHSFLCSVQPRRKIIYVLTAHKKNGFFLLVYKHLAQKSKCILILLSRTEFSNFRIGRYFSNPTYCVKIGSSNSCRN